MVASSSSSFEIQDTYEMYFCCFMDPELAQLGKES